MQIAIIIFLIVAAITAYLIFTPKERKFSKKVDESETFKKTFKF